MTTASSAGWPVTLAHEGVLLRPLRRRDARPWSEARVRNRSWLAPWEGSSPDAPSLSWRQRHSPAVFRTMVRHAAKEGRAGRGLSFAIEVEGEIAGQVTVSGISRGAFQSGSIGYWIDERVAGRGVTPVAVALVVDHCFQTMGLHRTEVSIRPENGPSRRVVEKLGFREEGRHQRFLFIDGGWRDHLSFALVREDVPDGLLRRYEASRRD